MSRRLVSVYVEADAGGHREGCKDADRRRASLVNVVARATDEPMASVVVDSRCVRCGRPHGKPRIVVPRASDGSELFVSTSSAAGVTAIAVGTGGYLGVDIESLERMSRAGVDGVAFGPRERDLIDDAPAEEREIVRTRFWTRKEAYLKATGEGVRAELTTIDVSRPGALDATIVDVDVVLPGLVMSVAMLGRAPVDVRLVRRVD